MARRECAAFPHALPTSENPPKTGKNRSRRCLHGRKIHRRRTRKKTFQRRGTHASVDRAHNKNKGTTPEDTETTVNLHFSFPATHTHTHTTGNDAFFLVSRHPRTHKCVSSERWFVRWCISAYTGHNRDIEPAGEVIILRTVSSRVVKYQGKD